MEKSEEPPAEVYIEQIGDPTNYDEIVFCGYGEPTIRWEVVKKISDYVKSNGGSTRLNTDGHGNIINKRDITPELNGKIDVVSISLNSISSDQYAELMNVSEDMHAEMIDFAKRAKKYSKVVMSIVGLNEVDSNKAKEFVVNELGVQFREREYF
jgi:TatD DNase family protein